MAVVLSALHLQKGQSLKVLAMIDNHAICSQETDQEYYINDIIHENFRFSSSQEGKLHDQQKDSKFAN